MAIQKIEQLFLKESFIKKSVLYKMGRFLCSSLMYRALPLTYFTHNVWQANTYADSIKRRCLGTTNPQILERSGTSEREKLECYLY